MPPVVTPRLSSFARLSRRRWRPGAWLLALGALLLAASAVALAADLGPLGFADRAAPICRGERATIVGTSGADRLVGTHRADVIWAGAGDDVVLGRGGDDLICARLGNDRIAGGAGDDGIGGGGGGGDRLKGGTGDDVISGWAGDDVIRGGRGNDRLLGRGGNDTLYGNAGDDDLDGGPGIDRCFGGPGTNVLQDCEDETDQPPVAAGDSAKVVEDSGATAIDVLANDTDADGGPKSIASVTQPANGSVQITGGGSGLTYQPNVNFCNDPSGTSPDGFTYTLAPGGSSASVAVTVTCVNDAPIVSTSGGSLAYAEGAPAAVVDAALTVADPDDTNLEGARVRISAGFDAGDELLFSTQNGITGSYGAGTGVLTLSGTSSVANYEAALRSVEYRHTGDNPAAVKTVEFRADDGDGLGPASTRNVNVTPVNDAPTVATSAGSASFTEGAGAVAVDPDLAVGDPDSALLGGATVEIAVGFAMAEDALGFSDQNGISGSYDAATGVLTLSGAATMANYQAALRSVTYDNSSSDPSMAARTVSFQVTDSGALASNVATRAVTVAGANDAPVVTTSAGSMPYTEGAAATAVDAGVTVTDSDDPTLAGARVRIVSGFEAGDELVFTDQNGIAGSYDAGTGVLTLLGASSVANYETALRSVQFSSSSDDPSPAKTVEFTANDGDADSAPAIKSITVAPVNDAPSVTTSGGSAAFVEGAGPVVVDPGVTLTDPDSAQLSGATVTLTSSFTPGEDFLGFTNQLGITGGYDAATGVLTLSGVATLASYQTALRSVTYDNSSSDPSTATRTVSFQVTDGALASNVDSRDVTVAGSNDAAVVTTSAGATAYTEGGAAVAVDSALTVTDADDANLEGATVRILAGFASGDALEFTNQNGISGAYDSGTGVLTLAGTSSVANYQAALRSVGFSSSDDDPALSRTVEFTANDGDADSAPAIKTIAVTPVNDAPALDTTNAALAYAEGAGPVAADAGITVTDADSTQMSGATVQVTSNFVSAEDELAFTNQLGITGSYDDATGTLTLSGTATLADYQAALRAVTYANSSDNPSTATRTLTFLATDAEGATSAPATRDITLGAANDAATITTTPAALAYTEGDPATEVDPGLTVSDPDDANLEGARVAISAGFDADDELVFTNQNGITGSYDSGTGVLTLTGTSSLANYQTALRSVQYRHTGDNPALVKTVEFRADDGDSLGPASTRNIDVTRVDDPPVAVDDSTTVAEGSGASAIGVLANDTDIDGGPMTIASASDPASGTVVLTGGLPGANTGLTYQPDAGYCNSAPGTSPDTFTYTLNGGSSATVSVTVSCLDDPPTAVDDSATVGEDSGASAINVLANDTDPDGGPKTIASASDPANGTVVLTGGSPGAHTGLTYQPDANYCNDPPGTTDDTFTYTLNGGSTATVSVTVTCAPDNPVVDTSAGSTGYTENAAATAIDAAVTVSDPDAGTTIIGATVKITGNYASGQDILALAGSHPGITSSVLGDTLTLSGTATLADYQSALRDVTYSNSSDNPSTLPRTVTFTVTDDTSRSGSDTKGITVSAVDDPPVAVNDSATVLEDAAATAVTVLTNDTDVDAGPKTISSASDPANGTVVVTGGGTGLTYQPDPNYCNDPPGTTKDTFTYTLNGGSTATASMTVTCVNDTPVADDETFSGASSAVGNTTLVVNDPDDAAPATPDPTDTAPVTDRPRKTITGDILAGDTDIDGPGPLTVTPGTFATNDGGSVTVQADGDFTFEPAPSVSCTDTSDFFDYTVSDQNAAGPGPAPGTDTGRVTIAISGCVWYVNNDDAQGNNGTSEKPFDTLAQAETASGTGHTIFVYDGNNTSTGYAAGFNLKANQTLIGEAAALVVGADTLHSADAANKPTITDNNADVVDLDDANEVRGFNIDPQGTGGGIAGSSGDTGGGTIDDVNIVDTGTAGTQPGLELDSTTGTFNISNLVVSTNGATGVRLHNTTTPANGVSAVFSPASQISITAAGAPALDVDGTVAVPVALGTSTFDDITVTGSTNGGVGLTNTTGTTTFGNLALTTTSGATPGFGVSNGGTISVPAAGTANVNATGGPAVDVTGTSVTTLAFDAVSSTNSANDGINLTGLGTGTFNAASGTLTGAAGIAFDLDGGSGDVSYPGPIGNGTGASAEITNRTGGTVTLSGGITDTNDAGGGVTLTGNTGATMNFSGGMTLSTGASTALSATGGGTFTVTGSANTLTTTTATALNAASTTIGSNGLTFRSIDSNGASNGIVLNTTGASGGLTVTGTATNAGSGGTIQNIVNRGVSAISTNSLSLANMNFTNNGTVNGADPTVATSACGDLITGSNTGCNAAIHMDGVSGASLTNLSVSGGSQIGINGNNVTNLTLSNSTVQNAGNQTREDGVRFRDLKGTSSITNSTLQGNEDNQLRIANGTGATGTLTISGSTFQNSTNPNGEYGFQLDTIGSGSFTTTIGTSTFNNTRGGGLVATAQNSSTLNVTASGGTWRGNFGAISNFDSAIQVVGADSANVKFNIHDITNPILGYGLNVIHTQTNSPGTESLQGQIINNVIGDTSSSTSASTTGAGIGVNQQSTSNVRVRLSGNTIRGVATFGITVQMGNLTTAATNMDAIVQNNNIALTNTATALQGIFFNSGTTSNPTDAGTFCADVSGNVASSVNADGLRLRQRFGTTVQLPGYAGGAADTTAVNTYLGNRNPSLGDTISSTTQSPGGFANANCDAPTLP